MSQPTVTEAYELLQEAGLLRRFESFSEVREELVNQCGEKELVERLKFQATRGLASFLTRHNGLTLEVTKLPGKGTRVYRWGGSIIVPGERV